MNVREKLIKDKGLSPSQVGEVELITITLNSKCRVDEAVDKVCQPVSIPRPPRSRFRSIQSLANP
jgi:hypothetical protein